VVDQAGQLIGDQAGQRRLRGQLESLAERALEIDEDVDPDRRSGMLGDVMAPPVRSACTTSHQQSAFPSSGENLLWGWNHCPFGDVV
jgi:hypothetical protein